VQRRSLLKSAALAAFDPSLSEAQEKGESTTLKDIPLGPNVTLTIERRGQIVLFGINRLNIQNRIDPETFESLGRAYYDYEHDPTLRVAILFGHGPNLSRGIDVDAFAPRLREANIRAAKSAHDRSARQVRTESFKAGYRGRARRYLEYGP
jgi:enoyl-CoA hydratase/carnithine racemase